MLINLSNHPSSNWSEEQIKSAAEQFGTITDLPFPHIDPAADSESIVDLAVLYRDKCLDIFSENGLNITHKSCAVHIMGEMTFTYNLVRSLSEFNVKTVASTTYRVVEDDGKGTKISVFKFSRFRAYNAKL